MQNVVFHITIPAGLKLVAGNRLMKEITFDFISRLDPYYSSVDYVKLTAGPSISKLSETTIASQIYKSSKQAKLIVPFHIPWEGPQHERLVEARTQYTTLLASRDLLLNIIYKYLQIDKIMENAIKYKRPEVVEYINMKFHGTFYNF